MTVSHREFIFAPCGPPETKKGQRWRSDPSTSAHSLPPAHRSLPPGAAFGAHARWRHSPRADREGRERTQRTRLPHEGACDLRDRSPGRRWRTG